MIRSQNLTKVFSAACQAVKRGEFSSVKNDCVLLNLQNNLCYVSVILNIGNPFCYLYATVPLMYNSLQFSLRQVPK